MSLRSEIISNGFVGLIDKKNLIEFKSIAIDELFTSLVRDEKYELYESDAKVIFLSIYHDKETNDVKYAIDCKYEVESDGIPYIDSLVKKNHIKEKLSEQNSRWCLHFITDMVNFTKLVSITSLTNKKTVDSDMVYSIANELNLEKFYTEAVKYNVESVYEVISESTSFEEGYIKNLLYKNLKLNKQKNYIFLNQTNGNYLQTNQLQ